MRTKVWLAAVLLCLLPIMALAQDQKDVLVQELYVKSGMERQFAQVPLIMEADFSRAILEDKNLQKLPENLTAAMKALIPEVFKVESLREAMVKQLGEKLTIEEIREVLNWLDSHVGKNCTRLEEDATKPEILTELPQYTAQIKNSPPPVARLELMNKLDAALKATESRIQLTKGIFVAFSLALNATLPLEQQKPPAFFRREVEKNAPQFGIEAKQETLIALLYVYRSLDDGQIKQYIEFLTSPAGSKYMSVSEAAYQKALFDGGIKWGKAVGEIVQQMKGQSGA